SWALKYPESYAYFVDETSWVYGGGACPAAQFTETLPAGGTLRSRWVWNGFTSNAASGSRPAPGGAMEIAASFYLGEPRSSTQLGDLVSDGLNGAHYSDIDAGDVVADVC